MVLLIDLLIFLSPSVPSTTGASVVPYAHVMNHQIHQGKRTAERLAASAPAPLWGEEEARPLLADTERKAHQWAIDSADEHAAQIATQHVAEHLSD